jgi:SecD/SecF fusion protein
VPFYSGEMIVKIEPDSIERKFSLKHTQEVLKKRLEAAFVQHRIEQLGNDKLKITFLELIDTSNLYHYITSRGELGFWELYRMDELPHLISSITMELNKEDSMAAQTSEKSTDELTPEIRSLIDTMETAQLKEKSNRVKFAEAGTVDGILNPPAELAFISSTDTSWFRSLTEKESVRNSAPADARICFSVENDENGKRKIYVIKTNYRTHALLKNEDIEEARTDFHLQNKPFVFLRFKRTSAPTWESMTEKNQGRYLAIVVDDEVISAPLVNGVISGGETSISGSFTIGECQVMSDLFKTEPLPVRIRIISRKFAIPPPAESRSRLTILVLSFFFFSGLAFVIFKILRTSKTPRQGTPGGWK